MCSMDGVHNDVTLYDVMWAIAGKVSVIHAERVACCLDYGGAIVWYAGYGVAKICYVLALCVVRACERTYDGA